MKHILLVGSGAREHAIAKALNRSSQTHALFCVGSHINPGIEPLCRDHQVMLNQSVMAIADYAKSTGIHFVIIGPEAPLAAGLVDALKIHGIPAIGPTQALAQIETSKYFARQLLSRYHIPGQPRFRYVESLSDAADFLKILSDNYVLKADGLMGGKGVKVSGEHLHSHEAALGYAKQLFDCGQGLLIEEKFIGKEFSLMSFTDGYHLAHMPIVQDHKRAYVGDIGPNTGGMGSYTCADHRLPFLSDLAIKQAQEINQAAIAALKHAIKQPYQGILYGGYMLTASGVKLIEFNARFGDPESINVLALLETDFMDICDAILRGKLNQLPLRFKHQASLCQYIVPEGYPDTPVKDKWIDLSTLPSESDTYYAAIEQQGTHYRLLGSRAFALLGLGENVLTVREKMEPALKCLKGPIFYREDLGTADWWEKIIA